jgi:hypothetical protein
LLSLTKQILVQVSLNFYANDALNWLKLIRAAIRYDKSLAASGLNLRIFLKLSGAWNRLQAKPLPSHSPASWNSIQISFWQWPEKSRLNYRPLFENDRNYSATLSAH